MLPVLSKVKNRKMVKYETDPYTLRCYVVIKMNVFREYIMMQGTAFDYINDLRKKWDTKQQDLNFV